MKHLLKLLDCTPEEITSILDLADQLKYERNITFHIVFWRAIIVCFPEVIHPYQSFV